MSSEASAIGGDQSAEALRRELLEAREQQAATAEILRVISSSPTDPERVFAEIAASAARLCDAHDATIFQVDGDLLRCVASHGPTPTPTTLPLKRELVTGRSVLDLRAIHVADVQAEGKEYPVGRENALRLGHRTLLAIPLMRAGEAIGVIGIRRTEVRPFTDRQIELLKTFADQAVIAIENTRLFEAEQARSKELWESLEFQTATADLLAVISRSPSRVQPVFDLIVKTAQRLCHADHAFVLLAEISGYRLAAAHDAAADWIEGLKELSFSPGRNSVTGRVALDRRTVHIHDILADPEYSLPVSQRHNVRTNLGVPLMRNGDVVGVIVVGRTRVEPFTPPQIALVETFADQAVIAIENTRLFEAEQASKRELQESLEYQTATSEVLNVISRSPSQVQPVLDAIAGTAARLCSAEYAFIGKAVDNKIHLAAASSMDSEHARWLQQHPVSIDRSSATGRTALERRAIHIPDILADPEFAHRDWQNVGGQRTILGVPLLHEGNLVGVIMLVRNMVRPFTQRQIELVTTFADQAVIAINNVRLFEQVQARTRELTESLEQQTATADVLKVISRSALDVQKVLDALVESAARLCNAYDATIFQVFGDDLRLVAHHGQIPTSAPVGQYTLPLARGFIPGRAVLERRTIQVADILAEADEYPESRTRALQTGYRTALGVPLVHAGEAIGVIFIRRTEVRPFTERQIELVNTFADQAVIAIENTRLFEAEQAGKLELQESLEYQTAMSEILGVISRSPTDVQPVFDAIAEAALKLCGSPSSTITTFDGELMHLVAEAHINAEGANQIRQLYPRPPSRGSASGRAILAHAIVQISDLSADAAYENRNLASLINFRSILAVPMMRDGRPIGTINVHKVEAGAFTDKQISLLRTFSDQAVIAIENTRLFEEVQARNRDLTALREVGRAVSSTLDFKVVLKTIVDRAVELSETDAGYFYYREEAGRFELGETTGLDEEFIAKFRKIDITAGQTGLREAIAQRRPMQMPDILARASNPLRDAAVEAGVRAALIVPLLSGEEPVGALVLVRRQSGEFPQPVVSLMQSFADQSAIALENARLFNEIAQKSRELEIASQHKSQFVANMSHELRTPLAAILGYAELMQEGFYGNQSEKSMDALTRIRSNGKHLLGLINTVLDIAKIESGQFTLNMGEYAIESVVETVRSATESLAQNKKLALKTEVAKSLPIGLGDEQRLTQVLLNLVGNAIKFTDAGEVRVTAKAVNGHFNVSVTDTGPGIPKEHLARIFEQFHQVDSSNTKAKGGTGLGLAIAKQIVEMHGGRIWVESTLGKGSTFLMELPTRTEFRKSAP